MRSSSSGIARLTCPSRYICSWPPMLSVPDALCCALSKVSSTRVDCWPKRCKGRTNVCCACASSAFRTGGASATSMWPLSAAWRANVTEVASTAKTGWPKNFTSPLASRGSPSNTGPMSLWPGTSSMVTTSTTPSLARTALKSTWAIVPLAHLLSPTAA